MNRSTRARGIGAVFALIGISCLPARARAATLVNCALTGSGTDPIARAFYVPNYPGVSLGAVTLSLAADTTGRYVLTLTAHVDTFDGPVVGSATAVVDLSSAAAAPVPVTFNFAEVAARPVPKGRTIAFVIARQGTGAEVLSFAAGAAGGCGAVETNDATPPLGTVRGSVPLTLTGEAAARGGIANGTFDTSVAGWAISSSSYPGTIAFSAADASGSSSSGSALVTNTTTTAASSNTFAETCVPLTGAGTYSFGGKIRAAAGQSAPGGGLFVLGAYPTPDCSGGNLFIWDQSPYVAADGAWHASSNAGIVSAGRGMNSVALILTASKNTATGTFAAEFDDVFLRPSQLSTLTLPGMASIAGQAGAFFHTDVWVLNHSYTQPVFVTAKFRCYAGLSCGYGSAAFSLAPRAQILYSDVLNSLLGASSTAGTLELTWDAALGAISASARTYSPSAPAPTNGSAIPALAPGAAKARAVFTGLASNGGDLTAGFRSNVGSYNPSSGTAHVSYTLYDDAGTLLGTAFRAAGSNEAFQLSDIFAAVEKGSTLASRATLTVASDVPIFSFVTVIDNQTNDSSFLLPTDDDAQP